MSEGLPCDVNSCCTQSTSIPVLVSVGTILYIQSMKNVYFLTRRAPCGAPYAYSDHLQRFIHINIMCIAPCGELAISYNALLNHNRWAHQTLSLHVNPDKTTFLQFLICVSLLTVFLSLWTKACLKCLTGHYQLLHPIKLYFPLSTH